MADRAHPFAWLVLGFVAGVAVTAALVLTRQPHGADRPQPPAAAEEATRSPAPAPPAPPPRAVRIAPPPPAAPIAPEPSSDDQVADDAAAGGMTSRATPDPATR